MKSDLYWRIRMCWFQHEYVKYKKYFEVDKEI